MKSHVFREYDIRGIADRDLDNDFVYDIGRALAELLVPERAARPPRIVVGRDCRLSSPRLFEHLVQGLVAGGAEVIAVGVGPSPMVYFAVHHLDADGGIQITGSHNPAEDNGFKIMRGKASFFGEALQNLRERIARGFDVLGGGSVQTTPIEDAYVDRLRDGIHLVNPTFPVVVDAGNGAAGPVGIRTLRALGLHPTALYCDMDGRFPNHHPDPTVPKNLQALIERVRREKARVGIAWDGDGDRLGVVDASGEIVWGDRILALFARYLLKERPGASVLGDVKCSQLLFDDIKAHGGNPIMWKTGHSLIKTKMKESGALLAGEMSGHFFFADRYYGYDDAIYAAIRLLEILAREGKTPLELLSDMPKTYATPEIRVDCPDELKFRVVDAVRERLRASGNINEIDGVRVSHDDGAWGLVRPSNTGPVIVLRFEAPTEQRLFELRREIEGALAEARAALQAG
jgi:phosphomannomutase/phosphoglucomutase